MGRQQRLTPDILDSRQRELYEQITAGPRAAGEQFFLLTDADGTLRGPFNLMLVVPSVGAAVQALGAAVRFETNLSARVRELAILAVAAAWSCEFERHAHEAVGRGIGLSDAEIDAVRHGRLPVTLSSAEAACHRAVLLIIAGDLSDEQWDELAPAIGTRALYELSTLVGYYAMLALQIRIFRVDADA
jgi:4-carboxymuconolactone decarboxylase